MSKQSNNSRTGAKGWFNWDGMRERDVANGRRVNLIALLWAASIIAVAALVKSGTVLAPWSWLVSGVPVVLGLLVLKASLKMLREMDEMMRQIQLEALASGFGVALIIGNTLVVLDDFPSGWIAPAIVAPMAIAYSIRVMLAVRELACAAAEHEDADA